LATAIDGQDGVGAEARFIVGAVEVDHGLIDEGLLLGIEADDRFRNLGVDVFDRLHHTLAEEAAGIAIAQFDRFARTGGSTGRHCGAPHDAALQKHIGFNGGIATGIENLSCNNIND